MGDYGEWGNAGTGNYTRFENDDEADVSPKQKANSQLAEFSKQVATIDSRLSVYGKAQDTRSFRRQIQVTRERGVILARELERYFKSTRATSADFCRIHITFKDLLDKFEYVAQQSIDLEREHGSFSASFSESFLGPSVEASPAADDGWLQQTMLVDDVRHLSDAAVNDKIREEQLGQLRHYDREFRDIREMMQDLGLHVAEDQEDFDKISQHIENSSRNIDDVVENLVTAEEHNRSASKKKLCCCVFILLAILAGGGVLVVLLLVKKN